MESRLTTRQPLATALLYAPGRIDALRQAALEIGAASAPLLMRTDPELALYGRYVVSKRLADAGFEFRYPRLAEALKDLVSGSQQACSQSVSMAPHS